MLSVHGDNADVAAEGDSAEVGMGVEVGPIGLEVFRVAQQRLDDTRLSCIGEEADVAHSRGNRIATLGPIDIIPINWIKEKESSLSCWRNFFLAELRFFH